MIAPMCCIEKALIFSTYLIGQPQTIYDKKYYVIHIIYIIQQKDTTQYTLSLYRYYTTAK